MAFPDEVLTDNGKVFTGRFGKPRPAGVLFERICRKNGIKQLLTKPYSPTTIGKVERWHQTLQTEFLDQAGPFATIEEAQAAVDAWHHEYNHDRPHQSLGMATPAFRFRPRPPDPDDALSSPDPDSSGQSTSVSRAISAKGSGQAGLNASSLP